MVPMNYYEKFIIRDGNTIGFGEIGECVHAMREQNGAPYILTSSGNKEYISETDFWKYGITEWAVNPNLPGSSSPKSRI